MQITEFLCAVLIYDLSHKMKKEVKLARKLDNIRINVRGKLSSFAPHTVRMKGIEHPDSKSNRFSADSLETSFLRTFSLVAVKAGRIPENIPNKKIGMS